MGDYEREREREKRARRKRQSSASAKEKSLKKPENKGEGACLLPRWPYHWRRQELLINAKKVRGVAMGYRQG